MCGRQIALGGVGGSHITSAVIQGSFLHLCAPFNLHLLTEVILFFIYLVLFNMITFGRSLEDAIEWPRLHHQLDPMYVEVEGENFISVDFFYELQILLEKLKNS